MESRITSSVQANRSAVSSVSFERYSALPTARFGKAMISAATPDFHANPSDVVQAARNCGFTEGTVIREKRVLLGNRNADAISRSCGSMATIASCTFAQTMGSTIKNAMQTGTSPEESHKSASRINDVTGVALTTPRSGRTFVAFMMNYKTGDNVDGANKFIGLSLMSGANCETEEVFFGKPTDAGTLAGIYPALRASRLEPVDALRS